ncbi:hypothetical protein A9Q99_23540 [Gammaproteobacteria bacterium 45_16_T64]|nr:hypothetical protein A9Q99_23540 [Gammaproteobacteria bacterium 45_16_T64]
MKRSPFIISALLPTMFLVGCGGEVETQRATADSPDLTGLWRMNLDSAQGSLRADSNISFTLEETANGLVMTECAGRTSGILDRENDSISGLPVSPFTIEDNDTLSATDDLGVANASKMDLSARFDMGSVTLSASELGNLRFSDLCVLSSSASVIGVTTQDKIAGTTLYNGEPLLVEVTVNGNIRKGTYGLAREPGSGEASLRLQSQSLKAGLNRTELTLASGTLNITEDGVVWMKGDFDGIMPNGNSLSGTFEFEKP